MVKYSIIRTEVSDKPSGEEDLDMVKKTTVVHMTEQRLDRRTLTGVLIGFLILLAVGGAMLGLFLSGHRPFSYNEVKEEMDRQRDYHRFRPSYERTDEDQDHHPVPARVGGRTDAKHGGPDLERPAQPGERRPLY